MASIHNPVKMTATEDMEYLEKTMKKLEDKHENLKSLYLKDTSSNKTVIESLEVRVSALQLQVDTITKEYIKLQNQLEFFKDQNEILVQAALVDENERECETKRVNKIMLKLKKQMIADQKCQDEAVAELTQKYEGRIASLQIDLDKSLDDRKDKEEKFQALQQLYQQQVDDRSEVEETVKRIQSENEELNVKIQKVTEENNASLYEQVRLREEAEAHRHQDRIRLKCHINEQADTIEALEKKLNTIKQTMSRKFTVAQNDYETKTNKIIGDLKTENKELQLQLEGERRQNLMFKAKVDHLETSNKHLDKTAREKVKAQHEQQKELLETKLNVCDLTTNINQLQEELARRKSVYEKNEKTLQLKVHDLEIYRKRFEGDLLAVCPLIMDPEKLKAGFISLKNCYLDGDRAGGSYSDMLLKIEVQEKKLELADSIIKAKDSQFRNMETSFQNRAIEADKEKSTILGYLKEKREKMISWTHVKAAKVHPHVDSGLPPVDT